jgi:hypothetical protein
MQLFFIQGRKLFIDEGVAEELMPLTTELAARAAEAANSPSEI